MESTRTLSSVLWQKFVAQVERHTVKELATAAAVAFAAGVLAFGAADRTTGYHVLLTLATWKGHLLPRLAFVLAVMLNARRICWFMFNGFCVCVEDVIRIARPRAAVQTVEGIPTDKLIEHLIAAGTFKGDEIEDAFDAPRYRVTKLAKKLREIGVLVTGPNNAAVLADGFTADDLASVFAGCSDADQLQPLFRPKEGGYTSEPSGHSPTPAFTRRRIAEMAPAA